MKIKKYITAIVLAMSLTTGLVVANATNDGVVKTREIKKENKKAKENKKVKEANKIARINPYVIGYKFKGKGMPEDPQKAFLQASEQNPYNYQHKANSPEVTLFLYILLNEFFEENKLDKALLENLMSGGLYYAYLDKNGKVISLFFNPGYIVVDNYQKPEEIKKFKKAFEKTDFNKIVISEENFKKALKEVSSLMGREKKKLACTLKNDKTLLKLLEAGKNKEAIKEAKKMFKEFNKKYYPKEFKNITDKEAEEVAKDVCSDVNRLKQLIKFIEQRNQILSEKIGIIKKLKFNDVKKLKNIFKMQEKVLEVPPYPAKQ